MKREDIEQILKSKKIEQIDLVVNPTDELAIYCRMKGGKLYDYSDHVVNRKLDIWGYLKWENGKSTRVEWED